MRRVSPGQLMENAIQCLWTDQFEKFRCTRRKWFSIGGNDYAVSYDHETERIEVREGSTRGRTLRSFDNKVKASEVYEYFKCL